MAVTLYTDVAGTSGQSGPALSSRPGSIVVSGKVLMAEATYTFVGTEAAAEVIGIVKLPVGAKVIPNLCNMVAAASVGTTLTVSVGDYDSTPSATRYSSAQDMHNAENVAFTGGAAVLTPYTLLTNCWITATLATASTPTAGKTIVFRIAYMVS